MITATLDAIGREDTQGNLVAYIKILKDGVLVENVCVKYDPKDDRRFRDEIRKRLTSAEDSIDAHKTLAASALAEVVASVNDSIKNGG